MLSGRLIGYVPQERAIDRFLTGREHLELLGALYHLSKDEAAKRIAELLKLVELEEAADRRSENLLRRDEAEARHCLRALARSQNPVPRRTDTGPGCAEPASDLGLCPDVEGTRHDDRHDDELSG